ncbi:MAG: hypothetical protein ACRDPK_20070 [Carbonactinosporaceae bacterium]
MPPNIRATEAIDEARAALPAPIPDTVAERAAALLDDLWVTALKHDIDPDELAGLGRVSQRSGWVARSSVA